MSLTPLVNLPSPSDPANFAAEADNFLTVQLPNLVTEWNTDIALFNNQDTRSTSTTSLLIGLGSKSLTVGTGKMYQPNMSIRIAHTSTANAFMEGLVTSYNSTTGALVVNVLFVGTATGTLNSWNTFLVPLGLSGDNTSITSLTGLTGDVQTSGATAKIGYKAGAGNTYNQSGNKTTGVTVTTRTGVITMNNASLAANAKVTFTVTLTGLTNNEHALVNIRGGFANQENYSVYSRATSGGFQVILWNTSAGALGEAVEILYSIYTGSAI